MRARHVLGHGRAPPADVAADVARHALATVQHLDRRRGCSDPDSLADELLRCRVQVMIQLEVVVDVERYLLPRRHLECGIGQGRQRRAIEPLEEVPAAGLVCPHHATVEVGDEHREASVEHAEAVEGLVADAREQPALRDLHTDLDLRLVPRRLRARGQDSRSVVSPELRRRPLDPRLVAARAGDCALQLVGHDRVRDAPNEGQRTREAACEIRDSLRVRGLRKRVVRRTEHRDEELDVGHLAGDRVGEPRPHARVVDEELVAGDVLLPHDG